MKKHKNISTNLFIIYCLILYFIIY